MQTLVKWVSVGRVTTTSVNLKNYGIKDGDELGFEVRATDLVDNTGKSVKSASILVDTTAPTPGKFTNITVTGVNDGKTQQLMSGSDKGLPLSRLTVLYIHCA